MNDLIRLELSGRQADAWNRVFGALAGVIENAIDRLAANVEPEARETAKNLSRDVAEIAKSFVKAKLERPTLENESTVADIALKFEQLKLLQANREQVEVETKIRKVRLDKERLEFFERQLTVAIKWLGFLQRHIVSDNDGSVTLVLTNQDMASLSTDVRAIQNEAAEGAGPAADG